MLVAVGVVCDRVAPADLPGELRIHLNPAAGEEERPDHSGAPEGGEDGWHPGCVRARVEGERDNFPLGRQLFQFVPEQGSRERAGWSRLALAG